MSAARGVSLSFGDDGLLMRHTYEAIPVCGHGHALTEANVRILPGPKWVCKACESRWAREYHKRRKTTESSTPMMSRYLHELPQ